MASSLSDSGKRIDVRTGKEVPKVRRIVVSDKTVTQTAKKKKGKQVFISDAEILRRTGASAIDARTGGVFEKNDGTLEARGLFSAEGLAQTRTLNTLAAKQAGSGAKDLSKIVLTAKQEGFTVAKDASGQDVLVHKDTSTDLYGFDPQELAQQKKKKDGFDTANLQPFKGGTIVETHIPSQPFLSFEGQKQRIQNVGRLFWRFSPLRLGANLLRDDDKKTTMRNPISPEFEKVVLSRPGGRVVVGLTNFIANNPYEAALIVGGAGSVGRNIGLNILAKSKNIGFSLPASAKLSAFRKTGGLIAFTDTAGRAALSGFVTRESLTSAAKGLSLSDAEKAAIARNPELYKRSLQAGFSADEDIGFKVPFFNRRLGLIQSVEAFSDKSIDSLIKGGKNVSQTDIDLLASAGLKTKRTSRVVDFASLVAISGAIETAGRQKFSNLFSKAKDIPKNKEFAKLFTKAFYALAPLGFIEGAVQSRSQSRVRLEDTNIKKDVTAGLFGAASAGVIGGTIVGLSGSTFKRGLVELGANFADLTEYPGDKLSQAFGRIKTGVLRVPVVTPTIQFTGSSVKLGSTVDTLDGRITIPKPPSIQSVEPISFGRISPLSVPEVLSAGGTPKTLSSGVPKTENFATITSTKINTKTAKTTSKALTQSNLFARTETPAIVPTNVDIPIPIPSQTSTIIEGNTPANIFARSDTTVVTDILTTSINTNVNIPVNIPVPVVTPQVFIPPFPPAAGGGGGGGVGFRRPGKKRQLQFLPSLVASEFKIKGKKPKFLTGLEVRPLPL